MPQLKSSPIGDPEVHPLNVTAVRPLLPNPDGFELCWGFLEDTAPGWWMVTVDGERVTAEWHVLDRGVCGRLEWRTDEKPTVTLTPNFSSDYVTAKLPPLKEIDSVRLRAAGTSCKKEGRYQVRLNGQSVGSLPTLGAFSCRSFLEIDREYWPLLKEVNEIRVTTADETMCIGGFVLEVRTRNRWVNSSVSAFYANTDQWDEWETKPLMHIAPEEEICCELSFG